MHCFQLFTHTCARRALKKHNFITNSNKYTLDFEKNQINIKQRHQTIIFLDECHLNPENIDEITTYARIETSELKKWLKKNCNVQIILSNNSIVEITFAVDSSMNLVARGFSGKIIALTLARINETPKWQQKKWSTKIEEFSIRLEEIHKKLMHIQNNANSQSSHLFLSSDVIMHIVESIENLKELENEVFNRVSEIKCELNSLTLNLGK